jgi:hypothetical protein
MCASNVTVNEPPGRATGTTRCRRCGCLLSSFGQRMRVAEDQICAWLDDGGRRDDSDSFDEL